MDNGRSIRAVKDVLPAPSGESEESESPRWIRAAGGSPGLPQEERLDLRSEGQSGGWTV